MKRKLLGERSEKLAAKYLQSRGYKILDKNFSSKFGEIDLVALDPSAGSGQEVLVFVEVRSRVGKRLGLPEESINSRKIAHIKKAGYAYKSLHSKLPESLRIDLVAITLAPSGELERIKLFKNITST